MANVIEVVIKATDDASSKISGLVSGLKAIGALAIAQKVLAIGMELGNLALQADTAKARFEAFAGGAQRAADVLAAVKDATGGALSEMDAMTASTKLMQMGLATSSEEVATLINMASKLGDQTMSAGDRVNDFALLLANQSIPRLDNFGISSGRVRERIAELQAATPGLTREMAFMQATVEVGQVSLDKLATSTGNATLAAQQGKAAWSDLKVEIGRSFSGAVQEGQASTGGLVRKFADLMKTTNEVRGDLGFLRGTLAGFADMLGFSGTLIDEYNLKNKALAAGNAAAAQGFSDVGASMERTTQTTRELNTGIKESGDAWSQYMTAMQQGASTLDYSKQGQYALMGGVKATEDALNAYRSALSGTVQNEMTSYVDKQAELRDRMSETRGKIADLRAEQDQLNPATQEYVNISQKISDLEGEYQGIIDAVGETADAHEEATKRILLSFLEQRMGLDGLTAAELMALQGVANQWGLLDDKTLGAIQATNEAVTALENGTLGADELAGALAEVGDKYFTIGDVAPDTNAALAETGNAAANAAPAIQSFDGGLTWITENGPATTSALADVRDGMFDVSGAASPAAGALTGVGGAASTAGGQISTAAQQAADLNNKLTELASRAIVIDIQYNIPAIPNIPHGGTPIAMASGFEGVFTRPTMALFGEAGPEYVKAVPRGEMNTTYNNAGDTIVINNAAQGAAVMARRARLRTLAGGF